VRFFPVSLEIRRNRQYHYPSPNERLRSWDPDKKQYTVEPGKHEFLIGAASDDIRLKVPMTAVAQ
jgi:hypothetical protein